MFGYVQPQYPELKLKEYSFYKSLYCGLCHEQKSLCRFFNYTLSYDFVFLALIRMGVSGETPKLGKKRCLAHPFRKKQYVLSLPSLEFTAKSSSLLMYYKLLDDINDEKGAKRLAKKFLLPRVRKASEKATLPELEKITSSGIAKLSESEKAGCDSVYEGAEIFGNILGHYFSYGFEGSNGKCLNELGNRIGRWIFILDAAADIKEDKKENKYNPFLIGNADTESDAFAEDIDEALSFELVKARAAYDLLDISDRGISSIAGNILDCGMPAKAREALSGKKKGKKSDPEIPKE